MNLTFLVISNKLKIRMTLFSHLQKGLHKSFHFWKITDLESFLMSHIFT